MIGRREPSASEQLLPAADRAAAAAPPEPKSWSQRQYEYRRDSIEQHRQRATAAVQRALPGVDIEPEDWDIHDETDEHGRWGCWGYVTIEGVTITTMSPDHPWIGEAYTGEGLSLESFGKAVRKLRDQHRS